MPRLLITAAFLLLTIVSTAQSNATPLKVEDKDVFVFFPPSKYTIVENVRLANEQISELTSVEEKLQIAVKSSTNNFDAIYTRDGISMMFVNYFEASEKVITHPKIISKKEIYFLSTPAKRYKTIATKTIQKNEMNQSFYKIAEDYINEKPSDKLFDAIIVSGDKVEYILFQ